MQILRLSTALVVVLAFSVQASAASGSDFDIKFCSAQTDNAARLACYDAIAARLKADQGMSAPAPVAQAPAAAPIAAPTAAPPQTAAVPPQTPESQFGAEGIPQQARGNEDGQQVPDEINSVITAVSYTATKRAVVTLANGQIWRQIDGDSKPFYGKVGDHVSISHGFISGYNVTVDGHSGLYKFNRRK